MSEVKAPWFAALHAWVRNRRLRSARPVQLSVRSASAPLTRGRMKAGPSNSYRRLLAGKITPERYVAILKRDVQMRLDAERSRAADSHEVPEA